MSKSPLTHGDFYPPKAHLPRKKRSPATLTSLYRGPNRSLKIVRELLVHVKILYTRQLFVYLTPVNGISDMEAIWSYEEFFRSISCFLKKLLRSKSLKYKGRLPMNQPTTVASLAATFLLAISAAANSQAPGEPMVRFGIVTDLHHTNRPDTPTRK